MVLPSCFFSSVAINYFSYAARAAMSVNPFGMPFENEKKNHKNLTPSFLSVELILARKKIYIYYGAGLPAELQVHSLVIDVSFIFLFGFSVVYKALLPNENSSNFPPAVELTTLIP